MFQKLLKLNNLDLIDLNPLLLSFCVMFAMGKKEAFILYTLQKFNYLIFQATK